MSAKDLFYGPALAIPTVVPQAKLVVVAAGVATLAVAASPTITVAGVAVGDFAYVSMLASTTAGNLILPTNNVCTANTITMGATTLGAATTCSYVVYRLV
jgi:hypothetical protein